MVLVPLSATDDELLQLVRSWLDVLAAEDYQRVFDNLGYAIAHGAGAEGLRRSIQNYRSPKLYPGVSAFRVSDWRTAVGGNPEPTVLVRRYKYMKSLPIVRTIELDLPLNGSWSDLEADFVVTVQHAHDGDGVLALEDICAPQGDKETPDA
jgi:hypothetical protein